MRIFLLVDGCTNVSVPWSQTWLRNFQDPLKDLGHDVFHCPADEGRAAKNHGGARRAAFSQKVLDVFLRENRHARFDLVFAYVTDGMLDPGVVETMSSSGAVTCNFSCNNEHQFYLVEMISRYFDYSLHSERSARGKFLAAKARPIWWPMASNPKYFHQRAVERNIPVSFVGGSYCLRARYVYELLSRGIDVQIYGPGWRHGARTPGRAAARTLLLLATTALSVGYDSRASNAGRLGEHCFNRALTARFPGHFHEPVSDEELVALYSRSHVSLGFAEAYENHDPTLTLRRHLHLRDFEAPMCGALYCTGYVDELEYFFEPDREVVVYRNEGELCDKVRYYLAHPEAAARIRAAGMVRALAEHTYQKRFQQLFREIGLRCDNHTC